MTDRILVLLAGSCLAIGLFISTPVCGTPALPTPGIVWPQENSDITPDPAAHFGRLPNGMTYVIYRNTTPQKNVSVRLRIAAGSMMEKEDERGAAHFVEHMAFNGTRNIPKDKLLPLMQRHGIKLGPDAGAFTAPDKTEYVLDLPSNDTPTLDAAFFIMREFAGNILFQPDAVERERGIILGEERLRMSPRNQAMAQWRQIAFAGQPFATRGDSMGTTAIIQSVTPQTLTAYYRAFYRPELATFVVVGDIDPGQIEARIRAKFGDWHSLVPRRTVTFDAYRSKGLQTLALPAAGATDTITVSWFQPTRDTPATHARDDSDLLNMVLVAALNMRLQHQAQQADAAYINAIMATQSVFKTAKVIQLVVIPKQGREKEALQQALDTYRQFVTLGVSAADIAPITAMLEGNTNATAEGANTRNSQAIADAIIDNIDSNDVFTSPAQDVADFSRLKPLINAQNLNQKITSLFTGDGPLLTHIAADMHGLDGSTMKSVYETAMKTAVKNYTAASSKSWPYTDFGKAQGPVTQKDFAAFGFTRYTFANGLVLNIKPTKYKDNQILISVNFKGGIRALSPQTDAPIFLAGIYAMTGGLTKGGLNKIGFEQMIGAISGKTVNLAYVLDDKEAVYSATTTPADLAIQMQLFMAYATDAAYNPAPFNQFHAALPALYAQFNANPQSVLQIQLPALTHANDKRSIVPDLTQAETVTLEHIRTLLRSTMENRPIEITMVGDVNPADAVNAVSATFATLPALPQQVPISPDGDRVIFPSQDLNKVLYHTGRADQSVSLYAWPVPGELKDTQETRGLEILTEILNQRTFDTVRQKLGQAYDANAARNQSWAFDNFGVITLSGSIAAGKDHDFRMAVGSIIDTLKTHPVSKDELNRARKPLLQRWDNEQNDNQHWLFIISHISDISSMADVVRKTREEMLKVTPAHILALARKYLRLDVALHVRVLPRQTAEIR